MSVLELTLVLYGTEKKRINCLEPLLRRSSSTSHSPIPLLTTLTPTDTPSNNNNILLRFHTVLLQQRRSVEPNSDSNNNTNASSHQDGWVAPGIATLASIDAVLIKVGDQGLAPSLGEWIQAVQRSRRAEGRCPAVLIDEPEEVERLLFYRHALVTQLEGVQWPRDLVCGTPPSWLAEVKDGEVLHAVALNHAARSVVTTTATLEPSPLLVVGKPLPSNGPSSTHDMSLLLLPHSVLTNSTATLLASTAQEVQEETRTSANVILQQFLLPRAWTTATTASALTTVEPCVYKLYLVGGVLHSVKVVSTISLLDKVTEALSSCNLSMVNASDEKPHLLNSFHSQSKDLFHTNATWTKQEQEEGATNHGTRSEPLWASLSKIASSIYRTIPLQLLGVDVLHVSQCGPSSGSLSEATWQQSENEDPNCQEEKRREEMFFVIDVNYWPSFEKAMPNASETLLQMVGSMVLSQQSKYQP